jgi:hypothetical protein
MRMGLSMIDEAPFWVDQTDLDRMAGKCIVIISAAIPELHVGFSGC